MSKSLTVSTTTDYKLEEGQATTAVVVATPVPTTAPLYLHDYDRWNISNTRNNRTTTTETYRQHGRVFTFGRIKYVLCYDYGMAVYIIGWSVWLGIGFGRRFTFDSGNEVCDELVGYMTPTIICGYLWATLVAFAFRCSFLCLLSKYTHIKKIDKYI